MNKKLIKILACSVCGLGITTSIPFMATSCGSSNEWPKNVIPKEAYKIENGILKGWADGWDAERIENGGYDTMKIPEHVTSIKDHTFMNNPNFDYYTIKQPFKLVLDSDLETINSYAFEAAPIISIDFSKCKNLKWIDDVAITGGIDGYFPSILTEIDLSHCKKLISIGQDSFSCFKSLNSVIFPGNLNYIGMDVLFYDDNDDRNINITWNDLTTNPNNLDPLAFNFGETNKVTGTVKSNSKTYSSEDLLTYLKQNCKLPSTFTVAA